MLDSDLFMKFRAKVQAEGIGHQTLIHGTLWETLASGLMDEETLRRVLREELKTD